MKAKMKVTTTSGATSSSSRPDKSKTVDGKSPPSGKVRDTNTFEESFEESRYTRWVDNSKTLISMSLASDGKEPSSRVEPVMPGVGGAVMKKGEEIVGRKTVGLVKRVVRKVPKRVQKEENNEIGNDAPVASAKHIVPPNCDIVNEVNTNNATEGEMAMSVVSKKVATERVLMEENDGDSGKVEIGNETELERPKNIDMDLVEFRVPNEDIVNYANIYGASEEGKATRVGREKVVTKGPKKVRTENKSGKLEGVGENTEAEVIRPNTTQFPKLGSYIANSSADYGIDPNIDTNAGIEEKTQRVMKKKVVNRGSERVRNDECSGELEKAEVDHEASSRIPSISVSGAIEVPNPNADFANSGGSMLVGTDKDASGLVAEDDVNTNATKHEKRMRIVRKKIVKVVRKKVVKKKQHAEELGKLDVLNEAEDESSNAIELANLNSDIASSSASDLLGPESDGFHVVETTEHEKTNPVNETSGNIDTNGSKMENNNGIVDSAEASKLKDHHVAKGKENDCSDASVTDAPVNDHQNTTYDDKEIISVSENMEVEKVGSEGSERSEESEHETESCDVSGVKKDTTIADDMLLSEEMEALERKKRRKTEIFIGGLNKDATEEDVRNAFQEVGEIVELTVKMHEKTGKNKGFAFVRYASATDAKKALEKLDKVKICGNQCSVSFVKGNDTIFLGNIDKRWKNEDIVKLLQDAGVKKIDKVTVKADPESPKRNRGFAFLEIQTIRDARLAFSLLEKKGFLGSQRIRVEWANEVDEEEMHKVRTVYAEYLPVSWDEERVKDHFKKFGEIENVVLARNLVSPGRKDFAFVNYKTREAALKCIDEFTRKSLHNEGSKVHINVSLAKSTPKGKQVKHASSPVIRISNQERPKAAQTLVEPNRSISKGESITRYHDYNRVVVLPNQLRSKGEATSNHRDHPKDKASTNDELVQLLREQASWRQPETSVTAGSADLDYSHSFFARKRQFSHLEDNPIYSDPRGYSRPRTESTYPVGNPSRLSPVRGMQSLPHYHQQGLSYPSSGLPYEVNAYHNRFQTRGGSPSGGGSHVYRRH